MIKIDDEIQELRNDMARRDFRIKIEVKIKKLKQKILEMEREIILLKTKIY